MTKTQLSVVGIAAGLVAGCALVVPLDDLSLDVGAEAGKDAPETVKDAGPDAPLRCDPTAPFATVRALTELDTPSVDNHATLSPDELQIWFSSSRSSDAGTRDIFTASRGLRTAKFGAPTMVAELSTNGDDAHPSISSDLKLVFLARQNLLSSWDIYVATRSSPAAAFGSPVPLGAVNGGDAEWMPVITSDTSTLFFTRGTTDANIYTWAYGSPSPPAAVSELSSPGIDQRVAISADALWIYWASARTDLPKTQGGIDVFAAHRASITGVFGSIAVVSEVSSTFNDSPDWISPDFCRLYLHSDRGGSDDLYVAERTP